MRMRKVRRITKTNLWELCLKVNQRKTWVLILHLQQADSRRERKLLEYLQETWAKGRPLRWDAKQCVYIAAIPYRSYEYVEETRVTLNERIKTHATQTTRKGTKQKMYGKLKKLGVHKAAWMPLETLNDNASKFHRLYREGMQIWTRDAKLNTLGAKTWRGDPGVNGQELITPKAKRFKLAKRLRDLHRRGVVGMVAEETTLKTSQPDVRPIPNVHMRNGSLPRAERDLAWERKRQEAAIARSRKAEVMSTIGRLARRPLHKQEGSFDLAITKKVNGLEPRKLIQVVKHGHRILDSTNTPILMANISKMTAGNENVVFVAATVRSAANVEPLVEKASKEEVRALGRRWARRGVSVFDQSRITARAPMTVSSKFGNTRHWGRKDAEEFG